MRRAPGISCLGALAVLLSVTGIDCINQLPQVGSILFADWRLGVVVAAVVVEEYGEHVGDSLALGAAHSVGGGIDTFGEQLVCQAVALAVATDDTAHLPEAEVVEEITAGDSDCAHEQLVDVVGVG